MFKFYRQIRKLKDVKRAGFVERGVRGPESVADHSLMTALLCMVIPTEASVDREKAIRMAIVHDLVEAESGDIISKEYWPEGGTMSREDQLRIERKAMKKISALLEPEIAAEVAGLWEEFEQGKTPEAIFAKDMDHMERTLQAYDYHKKGNFGKPLKGFWDRQSISLIKSESIKRLIKDIISKG